MLVLSHPGFTLKVFLLKAQKAILALQRPLWGEQGSNLSELNMFGDVVTHVYNVPEFKIVCSRSCAGGRGLGLGRAWENPNKSSQHSARRLEV